MKSICYYCKSVIGCFPAPDCSDCDKECKYRGKHSYNLFDIKIRFGGNCDSCYNNLLRDLDYMR